MTSTKQRFSLLLLEPGELYFDDYSVFFHPDADGTGSEQSMRRKIRGRLKVCSKSLVFDPQDFSDPIMKFPFKDTIYVAEMRGSLHTSQEVFVIGCNRCSLLRENNVVGAYVTKAEKREFRFSLNFAKLSTLLPKVNELFTISKMAFLERENELNRLVNELKASTSFDLSWLVDLEERIICESSGVRVTPLVTNPGRVVLTNSRVYFQPYNNVDTDPVSRYNLNQITRVIKRRHLLRQVGLEFFMKDNSNVFFSFADQVTRDKLLEITLAQPELNAIEKDETSNYTLRWQNGLISNYEYLSYLNSMADRTVNDLTQYPVFPWVIADYKSPTLDLNDPNALRDLSKPIGALESERLKLFKKRFREMPEPKFLYGTHYSTPGFVLYYLVRKAPEFMLCLQNGKFDHADRLFMSIAETWEGVLTNQTDVKELIPEFFQVPEVNEQGEVLSHLINYRGLDLGVRQNQQKVQDVILPPWAEDHVDFLRKNQAALECDYVSNNLHNWIDLIFGYKQRGEEAIKADNLFFYLTYEGAVDIDSITDPVKRAAIEVQINEFGQTPKQLFKIPHPKRNLKGDNSPLPKSVAPQHSQAPSSSSSSSSSPSSFAPPPQSEVAPIPTKKEKDRFRWTNMEKMNCTMTIRIHRDAVSSVCLSPDGETLYSVSQDSSLKIYSLTERKQIRSINVSELALSSCALSADGKSIIIGSWDNHVYVYSIEYGRVLDTISGHDDAVSSLQLKGSTLVTCSWDSTIKVWNCPISEGDSKKSTRVAELLDHDTEVRDVDVSLEAKKIVSGGADGTIVFWNMNQLEGGSSGSLQAHMDDVTCVRFSPDGKMIASCGKDGLLKVHEVDGGEVFSCDAGEPLRCLLTDGQLLLVGTEGGSLRLWELVTGEEVAQFKGHSGPITCLACSTDGKIIASGSEDQSIRIWAIPSI